MTLLEQIAESNRIEGIETVTPEEKVEHTRFIDLPFLTINDLTHFVSVYQPNAKLRTSIGMNVKVANYVPPPGGPLILTTLAAIISDANQSDATSKGDEAAWRIHLRYENLHPFTDCNGRSGRAIWYWMMRNRPLFNLGFLHAFYYQTLTFSP